MGDTFLFLRSVGNLYIAYALCILQEQKSNRFVILTGKVFFCVFVFLCFCVCVVWATMFCFCEEIGNLHFAWANIDKRF